MIRTFANKTTEDIFRGEDTKAARKIPEAIWSVARRKLIALDAAASAKDLSAPGNQLEKLKKELTGYWAIRINDQYRIAFVWTPGIAENVFILDYH